MRQFRREMEKREGGIRNKRAFVDDHIYNRAQEIVTYYSTAKYSSTSTQCYTKSPTTIENIVTDFESKRTIFQNGKFILYKLSLIHI